jgi:ABC-type taurine transport system substrate-binding protein
MLKIHYKKFIFWALLFITISVVFFLKSPPNNPPVQVQGVVLITLPGSVTPEIFNHMNNKQNLPGVSALLENGQFLKLAIRNGNNSNTDGWIQLMSGANSGKFFNTTERPKIAILPKNYSIYDRINEIFGKGKINQGLITSKNSYINENKKFLVNLTAPSENVIKNLDETQLSDETSTLIDKISTKPFFILVAFDDSDELAPIRLKKLDSFLLSIYSKLEKRGKLNSTLILVTSPYGIPKDTVNNSPATFLISSKKILRNEGDRRDIVPSILEYFGNSAFKMPRDIGGESLVYHYKNQGIENKKVKIGYFHGVRTSMFYRTLISGEFAKHGVDVSLETKRLKQESYSEIQENVFKIKTSRMARIGKVSGTEIIEKINENEFQGGVVGETAFIMAVNEGIPIKAVARLGYSDDLKPAYAMAIRSNLNILKNEDLKGLKFGSKRSAGGDSVFLYEYLLQKGINPETDVIIKDNIDDDKIEELLKQGKIDGAFMHMAGMRRLKLKNYAKILQKFNWVNPGINQAFLIFSNKFITEHPLDVEAVVSSYIEQIELESKNPPKTEPDFEAGKGMQTNIEWEGMSLPKFDLKPFVSLELLNEMQKLLIKHKIIQSEVNLNNYIDNQFVEKIIKEKNKKE